MYNSASNALIFCLSLCSVKIGSEVELAVEVNIVT
jgi:hypothetical protein